MSDKSVRLVIALGLNLSVQRSKYCIVTSERQLRRITSNSVARVEVRSKQIPLIISKHLLPAVSSWMIDDD